MTGLHRISIRAALIGAMLITVAIMALLVGALSVWTVNRNVLDEVQQRVDHDLTAARLQYDQRRAAVTTHVTNVAETLDLDAPDLGQHLEELRGRLDLTVLNVCRADGTPVAGQYPADTTEVPVNADPVLRRALNGAPASGTVLLEGARLRTEGGPALFNALAVPANETFGADPVHDALFFWGASPLRDEAGRVAGLVYGGNALNMNFDLVDSLRNLVFGPETYEGKPLGTVTIFMRGTRVSTNVLGPDKQRAVGTVVSDEVRRKTLDQGETWNSRAWVVDAWYMSAYEPLRNPDGAIIGMLYVGLLEEPYSDAFYRLILQLLAMVGVGTVIAVGLAVLLVGRITAPIERLNRAAKQVAAGDLQRPVAVPDSYAEVTDLARSFHEMQDALAERDRRINARNRELAETNTRLERANRNYMETLGFVTHELKSPLAAMQSMIDLLVQGYVGKLPDRAQTTLTRLKRNCEELQDMVKNYLDLSRAERGELLAKRTETELRTDVIDPCVEQSQPLFRSRDMTLEAACPDTLEAAADPELMRIALANFLSNAAKYGREGGTARLEAGIDDGKVYLRVWNEGPGFTPEEGEQLFTKFTRLRNENTAGKRGSGLGLFLCRQIMEQHGGRVWAESEPGQWACFHMEFPANADQAADSPTAQQLE
ncbi:MAG: cache domain-containing protein [Candidatus Hydrogenedentota bacterium]